MDKMTRSILAGTLGGLAAGAAMTGLMVASQAFGMDQADDAVRIARRTGSQLGLGRRRLDERPSVQEEAVAQGGHLALSAALGAAYGAVHRRIGLPAIPSGLLLGLGFYPVAFGVAGPLLGITEKPWEAQPRLLGQRAAFHAMFGIVTALVTKQLARVL
ncbi:MAG: hypothetical protein JO157_14955 [Acetobacteraceae bacterium]|nr:hypothetical protein [Acetobacteraceae bacterium]